LMFRFLATVITDIEVILHFIQNDISRSQSASPDTAHLNL